MDISIYQINVLKVAHPVNLEDRVITLVNHVLINVKNVQVIILKVYI
jgi:hypothetical protein